jgi:hypothetical protein
MKRASATMLVVLILLAASAAVADELRLRNGAVITGSFVGGDTRSVRFIGADGNLNTYAVGDIESLRFVTTPTAVAPLAPAAPQPQPYRAAAPAPPPASVTLRTGTVVTVRMIDSIDTDVTGAGERFRASIDDPISMNGQIVIPRGADATVQVMRVQQAGAIKGSDEVALKLSDVTLNGRQHPVVTNYAEVKSKGKGRQTAKTTAVTTGVGAVLGGIFGGGRGAAIGAGAGAGAGVAVSAARGKTLRIPSETRLDFVLRSPLALY